VAFYSQYLNIQDSDATPSNTFFVDSTSVDNGNNTGWVFVNGIFVFPTTNVATAQVGTPSITGDANVNIYNNLQFLDVQDCIAAGLNLPFYASGSVDSGNNQNWVLNPDAIPGLILATGLLGTVDLSTDQNLSVTGFEATSALGNITSSTNNNLAVTGLEATGTLGSVTTTSKANVSLVGQAVTSALGNIVTSTNNNLAVTGLSATSAVGSVATVSKANVSLTGQTTTSAVGSAAVAAKANTPVTGFEALSALGDIVTSTNNNIPVTGFQATSALGTVFAKADATIIIPSTSGSLQFLDIEDCIAAGPVLPFIARASVDSGNNTNWDISIMNPLPFMTAFLNGVTTTGKANTNITGLQANAQLGFGLVWGLINDNQNPNWVEIPN
jgi:hypothetical protein